MTDPTPCRVWRVSAFRTILDAHPYHRRLTPPSMNPTLAEGPGWYGLADDPHCPLCRIPEEGTTRSAHTPPR